MTPQPPLAAEHVLAAAAQLDTLVATSLREAVAQAGAVAQGLLARAAQLQALAAGLAATPAQDALRDAIEAQVGELLRAGQFHDIVGQAVERAITIQHRRAELVGALAAPCPPPGAPAALLAQAADVVAQCRSDVARHGCRGESAVELF